MNNVNFGYQAQIIKKKYNWLKDSKMNFKNSRTESGHYMYRILSKE